MADEPSRTTFSRPTGATPCERTYWVVNDRFLAGAYPGSPDQMRHRQRIQKLWDAGIRTFINLVEENETNNSGERFLRYDDILRDLAREAGESVFHLRFPVRDLSVPSTDGMRSILDAIDLSLTAEKPVYVHCFGGVGRTGTTVCCWLLRHHRAEPATVIELLGKLRQADKQTQGRQAPENHEQVTFVRTWSEA